MKELIEKVAKMRELQKRYFKDRDSYTLQACKKAEREVDAIIAQHTEQTKDTQSKLFS